MRRRVWRRCETRREIVWRRFEVTVRGSGAFASTINGGSASYGMTGPTRWRSSITTRGDTMERLPNVHPGEILREDYLIPLGMSSYRLAKGLGMTQTAVGEILQGKRAITPATALRLARFFGSTAEFWL